MAAPIAAMLLVACSGGETKQQETVEEKPRVMQVFKENVPQIATYTATIEANKTNNISSSTANRIKQILTDVGRTVRAGEVVVILDDVNIEQQRLRLENQKTELNRAEELLRIGGGTQQAVDQLRTEYNAALRAYNNALENTRLVSPINGVVSARNYDAGDYTGHMGMDAKVTLDVYGDEVFNGKVSLIHPTIDSATRTFKVEISIANANSRIRPGMFARVEMNYGSANHVVVPDRAIVKQTGSGDKYVYRYKDGKVEFVKVQLGQRFGTRYELIDGLTDDATVIVSGQTRLANGVEVDVIDENADAAHADTTATK